MDVWAYSGYTFEQLLQNKERKALLEYVDVLVDSPFVLAMRDTRLTFKGSKNQRIIDVKQSLAENKVILSVYDDVNAEF